MLFTAVERLRAKLDRKVLLDLCVKEYLDENETDDLARLARRHQIDKSAIQR
jgi:hypothetical protein